MLPRPSEALQPLPRAFLPPHEPRHAASVAALRARAATDRKAGARAPDRRHRFRQSARRVVARGAELLPLSLAAPDHSGAAGGARAAGRARAATPAAQLSR